MLPTGSIQFHFDLSSIWEVKNAITNIEFHFMVQHSGDGLEVSVGFCKITQYICTPVTSVVAPSTVEGYSVVMVSVTSLALSSPDNNVLTFTVETNGEVVDTTVSEKISEPFVIVCSSTIPSRAPSFLIHKHKRSVPGSATVPRGNASETTSQPLLGEEGQSIYQRDAVTCVLKSNPIKFADLGIRNVARPTVMDIKRCSGGCPFERTYSNKGVKHTELMALQASSYVSCRPLTYGATTLLYSNADASFSLVVEADMIALSCGCR